MKRSRVNRLWTALAALVLAGLLVTPTFATVEPEKRDDVAEKAFRHADLDISDIRQSVGELGTARAADVRQNLARLGATEKPARLDARSGRFVTLWPATPLVPGRGVGNNLTWSNLRLAGPPTSTEALENAAWNAFQGYLSNHRTELGIDLSELSAERSIVAHENGELIQLFVDREFGGIPVRGSRISAVISHGNLILFGMHKWGDRASGIGSGDSGGPLGKARQLDLDQAILQVESFLSPLQIVREWGKPELVYLPMAGKSAAAPYRYQLAWSVKVQVDGDGGNWEVLVDARSGEILANEDKNHYAEAVGGVQPVTNDGQVPDGVEYGGTPMPFMEVGSAITDTGGNYNLSGSQTARFYGPYVNMADNCGTDSLTQSGGIDWGTSGGTDCTTPGFGGSGNTHASRDGFYEINKLKEMARGQLPSNSWLQARLTSNMNINQNCNAFWNGSTINFYRSGGGCANTGEIAAVFDHEWGHGMDDFDVEGSVAGPSGEGIADVYTALRLNTSCIGRNFTQNNCSGFGDPCLDCTGVRDIDYEMRQSGNPHTYTWSNNNCSGSVHCVGSVYSEAIWSLWKRKLQSSPYNYDDNTAQEITTRLTFLGAGAVSTWFSGGAPNGGCGSGSGYQNYLAADDDNGNLNDGTPHMQAIYSAFNDQQIACGSPTVQDSGCGGTPSTAPTVNGSGGNQSASLSWNSISGTTEYEVFRTEGVFDCSYGKVKLGATSGTSWNDSGLQNGREYYYVVIPKGSSDACFGNASSCTTVTPASAPDFSVACTPSSQSIQQNASGNATCTVTSLGGFTGSVALSCSGNPAGIGCSFSPSSVSPPSNGSANSTLTLNVSAGQSTGTFNFNVVGSNGGTNRTSSVEVTVTPEGQNGPQDAVYDGSLGAPRCSLPGTECDSLSLLDGRASLGPEPNAPNTLDTCTDGTSGSYHSDESNDRIVVTSLNGFDFTEGATVEVSATVYAWSTGSSDRLDLYYAADANNPSWQLIGTQTPSGGGVQTMTAQYTLPSGSLQAVRANFRYNGSASPCSGGSYDDADDLVFAVNSAGNTPPNVSITSPANGATFTQGDNVSFAGTATDAEDGTISASLSWTSSIDGAIGSGASFSTSGLSVGGHTITASVTDSGGAPGSDSISITVNEPTNDAPVVTISSPANGSNFDEGTSVSFAGTAIDTEDGNISGSLSWSSSLDGAIGSGGSFSTSGLSVGTHTITASVTDSGGAPGSDSISVTIDPVGGGGVCNGTNCIDWDVTTTVSFATQDASANFQVQDGGDTMYLQDNTWRRTEVTFNVTANTVVEFDFTSTSQGEIHGIGFDEDNTLSSNRIFKVHGTQNYGITDFDNYAGGTVTYSIPVGQYFTGSAMYLVLVNDNDAGSGNDSTFSNVRVYESGGGGSCSVDEDFEGGAAGWTTSGNCSTGTFVLGTPTLVTNGGVTTQLAGDHTTGSGNALFTATNSSAGVNDVDGGTCTVTSPTYTVSTASDLAVWYFHGQRDAGGDSADGFLLEYSTNGGSTWTTLQQYGDVTVNANWTQATATGVSGSVVIRVSATDGTTTGDLVEAGLDDLSICD